MLSLIPLLILVYFTYFSDDQQEQ